MKSHTTQIGRAILMGLFSFCILWPAFGETGGRQDALFSTTSQDKAYRAAPRKEQFAGWEFLPEGTIFPAYLAGTNESRLGGVWNHDDDFGWIWDATLGGRLGLFRKGRYIPGELPEGVQIDIEGSAHLRLDFENGFDLYSTDYRIGFPISWGRQYIQIKTGFYHVSSHVGDEWLLRQYLNRQLVLPGDAWYESYSRDSFLLAVALKPTPNLRLYAELDFDAFNVSGEANRDKPLHIQFGVEYSEPYQPCRQKLSPFFAVHGALYQERDFDGNFCIQAGWQRRDRGNRLFRFGFQYYYGVSEQYQNIYWGPQENKFGIGLWYDY